jgi:hypothetical protein
LQASGIDADNDEIRAWTEDFGEFTIEWGEAAFVVTDPLSVDPHMGAVVGRANVQEGAGARLGLGVKVTLVEGDAFVAEKLGDLGIPVTGYLQGRSSGEVVLVVVWSTRYVGVTIQRIAVVVDRATSRVEGAEWGIVNQVVPVSVEAGDRGPVVNADQKRLERLLAEGREHVRREETCGKPETKYGRSGKKQDHGNYFLCPCDMRVTALSIT